MGRSQLLARLRAQHDILRAMTMAADRAFESPNTLPVLEEVLAKFLAMYSPLPAGAGATSSASAQVRLQSITWPQQGYGSGRLGAGMRPWLGPGQSMAGHGQPVVARVAAGPMRATTVGEKE